jgi:hypothetical protein
MEDQMNEELVKRIAALEVELRELKASAGLGNDKPNELSEKSGEDFRQWRGKLDYTEGFRLPASAAQAMSRVVPDLTPEQRSKLPEPRPMVSEPGWMKPEKPSEPVKNTGGWIEPQPLGSPSGLRYVDQQLDVADAIDRRELERKLGGAR